MTVGDSDPGRNHSGGEGGVLLAIGAIGGSSSLIDPGNKTTGNKARGPRTTHVGGSRVTYFHLFHSILASSYFKSH